jgi:polysaccharide biosynthesis/export protein
LEAGGPTDKADLKRVELTRGGRMYIIDLMAAFARDDENENVVVEAHDRFLVPKLPQYKKKAEADNEVYVFGAVNNPGKFSFAGKSHVVDAVARAGGLRLESGLRNIHIIRGTEEGTEVVNVDFNKLFKHHDLTQRVTILDGDIVYVSKTYIDKAKELLAKVQPILAFFLANPANFRDNYTTGGGLRLDTDVNEQSLREQDRLGGFSGSNP